MSVRTWFDFFTSRHSRPQKRRSKSAADGRLAARRLLLEGLEDRRLLAFDLAVDYPAGTIPEAVLTADFNGDARLDLAVANYGSSSVSVLLGNPDGTFQPAQNSATGTWPYSLAVGDFNADGKLDLATGGTVNVSVLLGNGEGTFQAPADIYLGGIPKSMAVGDFNGDGTLDLGVTLNGGYYCGYYCGGNPYFGYATVLLGTGTGTFAAPNSAPLGAGWHNSAAAADFNGDGNLDFAAASADYGSVNAVFGDGTGAFGDAVAFSVATAPSSVTAEDVNADGKVDLVTTSAGNNVSVLLGTGLGSFATAQHFAVGTSPSSVAIADFNGDGTVDLVTANELSGTVSVLQGTGLGSFGPAQHYAVGSEPVSMAVGDFNGDIFPDLAVANQRSDNASVLLNDQSWPPTSAPSVSISNSDVTVTEGNTGTISATFMVSLSAAYGEAVSVGYATADGTATVAGGDYQARNGTLTFAIGETSKTITVLVNGDRVAEYTESFDLRLSNPSNAFVTDAMGMGTIMDDEPFVIISNATVIEGHTGTREALFTVSLGSVYDVDVNVGYSTADGSAAAGSDYEATTGAVTIPAGQTSGTVRVLISGDRVAEQTEYAYVDDYGNSYTDFEDNEYFSVNLSSPDQVTNPFGSGVGVIVDDDWVPTISISDASVVEGNSGTRLMTFTVSLSQASSQSVRVNYKTANGAATTSNNDYLAKSGTITFSPGQTTKTITVTVKGDKKKESDEYFYVNLSGAIGAEIADSQSVGTILNDDVGSSSASSKRGHHASWAWAVDAAMDDFFSGRLSKRRR